MSGEMTFPDLTAREAMEAECADWAVDEEAFRAFYEQTARGLWSYLWRVTGERQLADDLLQETYFRFLRARSSYENQTHRRNALYRIATNLARDARRRRLIREPFGATGGDNIEKVSSRHDAAASAERASEVALAMSKLKPREREMLWLAYAEGASHAEIAGVLGLRADSLRPMLSRVRRKFASLLGGGESTGGKR
jgi:RNA polymerase sigma-70 factor, ECF subfamily